MAESADVRVKRIITRFPNLECGFFAALLEIERVRRHLGISRTKELEWEFVSTGTASLPKEEGILFFNVGGGEFDQHGQPENRSLCELCSLDLVKREYDFLKCRPWLRKIFEIIRKNDIDGTRISRHPLNLRELMVGLTANQPRRPKEVLEFLKLAFGGVFQRCQSGVSIKKVFDPNQLIAGVKEAAPDQLDWFVSLVNEAKGALRSQWNQAQRAVKKAEELGKVREVQHFLSIFDRPLKVIGVLSDSVKVAQAARQAGYDVVITFRRNGHYQVFSSTIKVEKPGLLATKWRVDLGGIACRLRIAEAKFCGKRLKGAFPLWTDSGRMSYTDGTPAPGYLAEFRTGFFHGSQSNPNVPPTKIRHGKILDEVARALPNCGLLSQEADGGWNYYYKS